MFDLLRNIFAVIGAIVVLLGVVVLALSAFYGWACPYDPPAFSEWSDVE